MKNEMRELIDQVKNFGKSQINENLEKRKLEDKGFGSKPERYIYLGTNPNGSFSYYYYPSTNSIETFKGSIEGGNHMSYSKPEEFFVGAEPIDSAIVILQNLGVNF